MRKYDYMYIIRPTLEETKRKTLIEDMKEILTSRDTTSIVMNEWGMRDLAYPIEKHTKGFYVVITAESSEEGRSEFDRMCRIKEDIIRHIIVRLDK